MKFATTLIVIASLHLLSGCETVKPTAESLRDKVAGNLGFQPADVKVAGNLGFQPADVKVDGMRDATGITYFVATTPKGTYGCSIPSGGMTAAATLGMVNLQPTCTKQ